MTVSGSVSERPILGFIGLGNMGNPMASRLVAAEFRVVAYDSAGTRGRAPVAARSASSSSVVAAESDIIFLALPDGIAVSAVTSALAGATGHRASLVIDTSTIGIAAARAAAERLAAAGIGYLDAPVSGGVAGARAGSLAMMVAGPAEIYARLAPILGIVARNCFHVGLDPGQAQAVKLLNNFLSATALAATSEAIAFGVDHGLDMKTMLDVLNVSSGKNTATADKFPSRILTQTYDAGFATRLMAKDVRLYLEDVRATGAESPIGEVVKRQFAGADAALPESDFTRIYDHVCATRRPPVARAP